MARFNIYAQDGSTVRYAGAPVYHGTHLKPGYIEFREIASPVIIPWQIGDYVDYTRTGLRYKLYNLPFPTKQAASNAAGDSFIYKDVQFFCASKDLEIAPFRDLVISDNTIHFTTLSEVATYEDVYGIARRVQANLDSFYGEGAWVIRVVDTADTDLLHILKETKEFSLSDGSCLDALSQIYSQWKGIGWVYSVENGVDTITIGRPNVQDAGNTTSVFAYGIGNGLTLLRKEQSDKNDLATRLYAYGSTRNLIARYYNNITPAIKDAQSVYIPNLMIPPAYWGQTGGVSDARKAYLEAPQSILAKYGLRPKTIYFDGSGDYEEIFPSIETMTAGQLRAAMDPADEYYPKADIWADADRVDEAVAVDNPQDDGVLSDSDGGKYIQSVRLLGVGQHGTYTAFQGQESIRVSLGDLTVANTISEKGKVRVTPAINGTITSDVSLGSVAIYIWLEIDGKKYSERPLPVTQDANGGYIISSQPFELTTRDTGSVVIKGYILATPTRSDVAINMPFSLTVGATTLDVQYTPSETFKIQVRQLGFDISKQQSAISDGLCTIALKTGWCAGREFTVTKCEYQPSDDRWLLTVARQNDESIGQYFPNSIYRIEAGDRFVLTDLSMPEVYITAAQQRLYKRAGEVLEALSTPKIIYEPEIDAKVLASSPEVLMEGMYMPIRDEDLVDETAVVDGRAVHQEWVLIDSIEIDEGSESIPTYKVTLQDEKREGFLARLTRESGRNTRSITEITLNDLRTEVETLIPDYAEEEAVTVRIAANATIIGYEKSLLDLPANDVVLTCETSGIDEPSYQWYYYAGDAWQALDGATAQAYQVNPTSALYFPDGTLTARFMVIVNNDPDLSASIEVMKVVSSSYTVALATTAHIFEAGMEYAVPATDSIEVVAFAGLVRSPAMVRFTGIKVYDGSGTQLQIDAGRYLLDSRSRRLTDSLGRYLITSNGGISVLDANGHVVMTIAVIHNGTTKTTVNVSVTSHLNIPVGRIVIPVVIHEANAEAGIEEEVVNLTYSWALALQGESPIIADIDNEMDGIALDSDGKTAAAVTLATNVSMWLGTERLALTSLFTSGVPSGVTETVSTATGHIEFSVPAGMTFSPRTRITIIVSCRHGGATVTRALAYIIAGIRNGEAGAVYMLQPSVDAVKKYKSPVDGKSYSADEVSCVRMVRLGGGALQPSSEGVLTYSIDGGTEQAYSVAVPTVNFTETLTFFWRIDGVLIDRETIPLVADGADGQDGEDGRPGENGYSTSTIYLYQRSSNGAPKTAPGDTVFTFASGEITPASGKSLNDWQRTIPVGSAPCYVTMYFAQANTATIDIPGGWVEDGGSWCVPTRLTGDNGLAGKIMRGINEFSSDGLPGGRPDGTDGYQGLDETDTSVVFYDVVYRVAGGTRNYFYCKDGVGAKDYTPGVTPGWENYWSAATNFDFIATRVLLASNAFIDVFSGNAAYMYDDGQSYIVAGMQGGSATINGKPKVNFFAGTDANNTDPQNAPFRVNYDGSVDASNLRVTGGSIQISDNNVVKFLVTSSGKLTASDAEIIGSIVANGTAYDDVEDGVTYTYAIKSNNGIYVVGRSVFSQIVASSISAGVIEGARIAISGTQTNYIRSRNDAGTPQIPSVGEAMCATEVNGSVGTVRISAITGSTQETELLLTTLSATLRRGAVGTAENILSSADIEHVVVCTEATYPASPAANTLYIIVTSS